MNQSTESATEGLRPPATQPTPGSVTHNFLNTHTHTLPFNGPFSGITQVSRYHKGETSLDFTEARDSEWQWHQLGHMQVCTSLQTDNHASTRPLRCPSCRPTNSVKALKVRVQLPETSSKAAANNNEPLRTSCSVEHGSGEVALA